MTSTQPDRVLQPFLDGLRMGEIRFQACLDCEHAQTLARYACSACGSSRLRWRSASGGGTVHSVTVVGRAPSDEFEPLVPYTLVLVMLDEGPRLMAHAVPGVLIGQRVTASFFQHAGRTLLRFATP